MASKLDLFDGARALVQQRCDKVGLSAKTLNVANMREDATFWSSRYACVLLWPIRAATADTLRHEAVVAEGVFHDALNDLEGERRGRPVDGYLILALDAKPPSDVDVIIRALELSSRVCRKHVVWPEQDDAHALTDTDERPWPRIESVTVLGLPDVECRNRPDVAWPTLEPEAGQLWAQLEGKNVSNVARRHGNEE